MRRRGLRQAAREGLAWQAVGSQEEETLRGRHVGSGLSPERFTGGTNGAGETRLGHEVTGHAGGGGGSLSLSLSLTTHGLLRSGRLENNRGDPPVI